MVVMWCDADDDEVNMDGSFPDESGSLHGNQMVILIFFNILELVLKLRTFYLNFLCVFFRIEWETEWSRPVSWTYAMDKRN